MRKVFVLASALAALSIGSARLAADEITRMEPIAAGACGCAHTSGHGACGDACGSACGHACGLWGNHGGRRRRNTDGRDAWFHCGCNGSYKFPVPPLSTYHWPGLYSHQLMTDYHSPWRFPPIKPIPARSGAESENQVERGQPSLLPVRAITGRARPSGRSGLMSEKLDEMFD